MLCKIASSKQCLTTALTCTHFADVGIIVSTTFKPQLCNCGRPSRLQPAGLALTVNNKHNNCYLSSFSVSCWFSLLFMTKCVTSEMHFKTFEWNCSASCSLMQPCLIAYCIWCNTPMIQAFCQALQFSVSLGMCSRDQILQWWIPNMAAHD